MEDEKEGFVKADVFLTAPKDGTILAQDSDDEA